VPKRPKRCSWGEAGSDVQKGRKCLHVGHFPPPHNMSRHSPGEVWGTGGPEFESRRPDSRKAVRDAGFRPRAISQLETAQRPWQPRGNP